MFVKCQANSVFKPFIQFNRLKNDLNDFKRKTMNRVITQTTSLIFVISFIAALASCKSHDAINFESNTKDEIIEYNKLRIKTEGQYYNWDEYLNYREFIKDKKMSVDDLIRNPGSYVFHIDREKGELIRYDIWRSGAGFKDKFNCKKISYFSLPKKKINKKF